MKSIVITVLFFVFSFTLAAQNVGIGTTTPAATAQLDVSSINKGILIPRMTQAQRTAIAGPALGLSVYQTDGIAGFYYFDGALWVQSGKGGNFFLPYSGSASTLGGAEFSISHTGSFGDAAYFNNTGVGSAITTGTGNNKFNMTSGNTGIGIPTGLTENPTLGRLVVRGSVGATVAVFDDNNTGISLQSNFPSVGFNEYYNAGSKFISTGYGGKLTLAPGTGDLSWYASNTSGVADGTMTLNQRLGVSREGSMFVQGLDAGYIFKDRTSVNYAGWNLYANAGKASLYRYTQGGNTITVDSTGALGLQGVISPTAPLSFPNTIGNKIALWGDATGGHYGLGIQGGLFQIYSSANNADIAFGYGSSNTFTENARLLGNGNMHLGKYSTWATIADNRKINFGDGDYVFIGEQDADDRLTLNAGAFDFRNGDVFIGITDFTKAAGYKLRVNGKIIGEEVRVQLNGAWPDYVFAKNYKLPSIPEMEKFISINNHLPGIQPAAEVEKNGLDLGNMNKQLLEKIEELSLYIIQLNKRIEKLEAVNK